MDTLSWGFITSGNSGGVDRSAMTTGSNSPSKTKIKVCTTLIFAILDNSCHYKCHLGVARTILCFHCHAIKDKNANHSVQKVQNLGNGKRYRYKKPS